MRHFLVLVLCCSVLAPAFAAEMRPAERVKPAPQVNPKAVVWRTPKPPKNPQAGDIWVNPKDGAEMVYVAAGEFILGTSDAWLRAWLRKHPDYTREQYRDQQPSVRVKLPGYWIDKHEVTVAQYRKYCTATGRRMPQPPPWGWKEDHPIVMVSWHDAVGYGRWASKRLPSELEWEKAARGIHGRTFPWGDRWDAGKCANGSNSTGTKPIGSYPAGASPYGVLDMAGNVWEWCADWREDLNNNLYRRYAQGDLTPSPRGWMKMLRGGSWQPMRPVDPEYFSCAHRSNDYAGSRGPIYGFRCARDAAR